MKKAEIEAVGGHGGSAGAGGISSGGNGGSSRRQVTVEVPPVALGALVALQVLYWQ